MNEALKKKNASNPGCGAIGYCHAIPGIDRVSELFLEDILRSPVALVVQGNQLYMTVFFWYLVKRNQKNTVMFKL